MVLWTELSCHVIVLLLCLLSSVARNLNEGAKSRWMTRFLRREIKRAQDSRSVVTPNSKESQPRTANNEIGLDLWRTRRQGTALAMNNPYVYRNQISGPLPLKYWNYNTWANRNYVNPLYFNPRAQAFYKPYNRPSTALGNGIVGQALLNKNLPFFAKSRSNVDEDKKFVEDKIQEYYEERLNKNKNQWMYKLVNGTSRHIKSIFIGRCWDFILNKGQYLENPSALDCKALWKKFKKGFAYKDPCAVTDDDYTPFFDMYKEKPLRNKVMLWSGTRELTHAFSRLYGKYTTLEDTFAGFLLNGLRWCGTKKKPGINYTSCPYECSKQKPFFGHAAERLAMRARGVVHVMLNGTRQHFVDKQIFPTFMDYSYLGRNQLTSLPVTKITEFRILVGHSLHQKSLERCGSLTVLELQNRARERGLKTTCYDNPYFIRHLLCLENPGDPLCLFEIPDQETTL